MGETRKAPETQKEAISQLWWTVIGTNGDGLKAKVEETHDKLIQHLLETEALPRQLEAHINRLQTVEEKVDAHHQWHTELSSARRTAIAGWIVATLTTLAAAVIGVLAYV